MASLRRRLERLSCQRQTDETALCYFERPAMNDLVIRAAGFSLAEFRTMAPRSDGPSSGKWHCLSAHQQLFLKEQHPDTLVYIHTASCRFASFLNRVDSQQSITMTVQNLANQLPLPVPCSDKVRCIPCLTFGIPMLCHDKWMEGYDYWFIRFAYVRHRINTACHASESFHGAAQLPTER